MRIRAKCPVTWVQGPDQHHLLDAFPDLQVLSKVQGASSHPQPLQTLILKQMKFPSSSSSSSKTLNPKP